MPKKIIVIGAGFAGISAATNLAAQGYDVQILEKNDHAGGRARVFEAEGFRFDMGPSWYWMPDVFEAYFARFGAKVSDFYTLERLNPSYRVVWGQGEHWDIPAHLGDFKALLESVEPGSGKRLDDFLSQAAYKYRVGINDLVYRPGRSLLEFADIRLGAALFKMDVMQSIHTHVRRFFSHPRILQLMEFPILFLGATPRNTPALYSLMNYADIALGTWYPQGGMHEIVRGMVRLAERFGVKFAYNQEVRQIFVSGNRATKVITNTTEWQADAVVAGADYHHIETQALEPAYQSYSARYWDTRTLAPSSLIFYLGVNKRLDNLLHHNLYFDTDFGRHAEEIYTQPQWPSSPLFYVSAPSKTDSSIAPEGCENLFILIPVAPNLPDDEATRVRYFDLVMDRLEQRTGQAIRPHIVYKRSYAHRDFQADYHAFKGNAYGLANTLLQTAILKPALKSKKVRNLYYTGQLTVPGPGVPPSLISGIVVAREILKEI